MSTNPPKIESGQASRQKVLKSIVLPEEILEQMIDRGWLNQRGEYIWELNSEGASKIRGVLEFS